MTPPEKIEHPVHHEVSAIGGSEPVEKIELYHENGGVLLDIGAGGAEAAGASLKLAKDGHVRDESIPQWQMKKCTRRLTWIVPRPS
jgi:hypothetical protein